MDVAVVVKLEQVVVKRLMFCQISSGDGHEIFTTELAAGQ